MNATEIKNMIVREINDEMMRTGKTGTEVVGFDLYLSDKEIETFQNEVDLDQLEGNWFWEVEGNKIAVSYSEE